jgi:hypothetical protein
MYAAKKYYTLLYYTTLYYIILYYTVHILHIVFLRSVRRLRVSSLILITLMLEAIRSSEMPVLKGAIRRNIPDDGILQSHRREKLKCYIALTGWTL